MSQVTHENKVNNSEGLIKKKTEEERKEENHQRAMKYIKQMRLDKNMNRDEEEKIITRLSKLDKVVTPYIIKKFSSSRRSCCSTCSTSRVVQNKKEESKEIMPKYEPP